MDDFTTTDGLTAEQRNILYVERSLHRSHGYKMQMVHSLCRMGEVEYYRKLAALVRTPAAQAFDPITCRRVLDLRDARRAQRSAARMPS